MQVMWPLPRRVRLEPEFRDKIHFGCLMHLVGYFIRRKNVGLWTECAKTTETYGRKTFKHGDTRVNQERIYDYVGDI
jgi:hypothetical protein